MASNNSSFASLFANSSLIPTSPSPQLLVVLSWAAAINAQDPVALAETIAPQGFEQHFLPAGTAKKLGMGPIYGKEAYVEQFKKQVELLKGFKAIIHEVIEEPGKVVLHATGSAQSITGHAYTNEWMLTYHLVQGEAGGRPKVSLVKMFFDSESMASFIPAEMERVKKLQGEAN